MNDNTRARSATTRSWVGTVVWVGLLLTAGLSGCSQRLEVVPESLRKTVDRRIIEYPTDYELKPWLIGLDSPTGICWDDAGNTIVAEGGFDGADPRIVYIRPDGSRSLIYPHGTRIPILHPGFRIYGPIGGIAFHDGHIFVSHRDKNDLGVITEFGYDGTHRTVVAGLPAQGDYGMTDLCFSPIDGRLYFGVGAATNSGVVGLDNWAAGWVAKHPQACDIPYQTINLLGYRFDAANPLAGIFAPGTVVTRPFEPFGISDIDQILAAAFPEQKPTGAVFSVSPEGGDLRVEAWGVHNPAGIAVNEFNTVYVADQGMEMRGTRPVVNDPDALFQLSTGRGVWLWWPDYTRSGDPVSLPKYQPPRAELEESGYPNVRFVIDHDASRLPTPDRSIISALFDWQSGAGKMAFIPRSGPFHKPAFEGKILVALSGDRAPFSTNGNPFKKPYPGYRVEMVDPELHVVKDFVYNTVGGPSSELSDGKGEGIERPCDVKFSPDGTLYIVDFGKARYDHGQLKPSAGTGKIWILTPATQPAAQ